MLLLLEHTVYISHTDKQADRRRTDRHTDVSIDSSYLPKRVSSNIFSLNPRSFLIVLLPLLLDLPNNDIA